MGEYSHSPKPSANKLFCLFLEKRLFKFADGKLMRRLILCKFLGIKSRHIQNQPVRTGDQVQVSVKKVRWISRPFYNTRLNTHYSL